MRSDVGCNSRTISALWGVMRAEPKPDPSGVAFRPVERRRHLPRLVRAHYQADAMVLWTLTLAGRTIGWLSRGFHTAFREAMFHVAARESVWCPVYCLMPDHIHLIWMGTRLRSDQRRAMRFLRVQLAPALAPRRFQRQAHDHVLLPDERGTVSGGLNGAAYLLANPVRAGLVGTPAEWPYLGAVIPGHPGVVPWRVGYWEWYWSRYHAALEPGIDQRTLPARVVESQARGNVERVGQ